MQHSVVLPQLGNISRSRFQVPLVNQRLDHDPWLSISDWQVHHVPTTLFPFTQNASFGQKTRIASKTDFVAKLQDYTRQKFIT